MRRPLGLGRKRRPDRERRDPGFGVADRLLDQRRASIMARAQDARRRDRPGLRSRRGKRGRPRRRTEAPRGSESSRTAPSISAYVVSCEGETRNWGGSKIVMSVGISAGASGSSSSSRSRLSSPSSAARRCQGPCMRLEHQDRPARGMPHLASPATSGFQVGAVDPGLPGPPGPPRNDEQSELNIVCGAVTPGSRVIVQRPFQNASPTSCRKPALSVKSTIPRGQRLVAKRLAHASTCMIATEASASQNVHPRRSRPPSRSGVPRPGPRARADRRRAAFGDLRKAWPRRSQPPGSGERRVHGRARTRSRARRAEAQPRRNPPRAQARRPGAPCPGRAASSAGHGSQAPDRAGEGEPQEALGEDPAASDQ